ncbi:MAG: diphosphomevalonate decarboxylase [Bdellovibrionaceae bacterium]|nr:diphosphomevalonate decarboxylase [Pseudobdellovibrionaceae bacterium]
MGKIDASVNAPTNKSLSYTLGHLLSYVHISLCEKDSWEPLLSIIDGEKEIQFSDIQISEKGQARFLKHLNFLKTQLGLENYKFKIQSNNLFPQDCGLASSASSFAALTSAVYLAAQELVAADLTVYQLANLSQRGSGSSCRSFFSPWSIWESDGAKEVSIDYDQLLHMVIVVEDKIKSVSSSEAHLRVTSSSLFNNRVDRANTRCLDLLSALNQKKWKAAYEITWAEFWDMHVLFETAEPHFSYMTSGSLEVLRFAEKQWLVKKDGPLVTMDAGANVHLIYRKDQQSLYAETRLKFSGKYKVFGSNE